jgi:hypothetical protein
MAMRMTPPLLPWRQEASPIERGAVAFLIGTRYHPTSPTRDGHSFPGGSTMLAVMLALFFPPAPIEKSEEAPKGLAPQIVSARIDKAGNLVSTQLVTSYVTMAKEVEVIQAGKKERHTVYETVPVQRMVERRWSLEKATATEAGGKKLDKKALAKRLAKPAAVVLSGDGRPVDPGYLKLFKKDVIVITLPPAGGKMFPEKRK